MPQMDVAAGEFPKFESCNKADSRSMPYVAGLPMMSLFV